MRYSIFFILIFMPVLMFGLSAEVSLAATIVVNATLDVAACETGNSYYTTITDAVDNAVNGDTVVICPYNPYYNENIVINKNLTIRGNTSTGKPIVNASISSSRTIRITNAYHFNISGLDIIGGYAGLQLSNTNYSNITDINATSNTIGIEFLSGSSNNTMINSMAINNYYGIYLDSNSNNNSLINNTASRNTLYGFYILTNSNNLTKNVASFNAPGFTLESSSNKMINNSGFSNTHGLILNPNSVNNTIKENNFYNNTDGGIWVDDNSNNTNVINNNIYNNTGIGIRVDYSTNITIANNNIYNNTEYGIQFTGDWSVVINNSAYNSRRDGIYISYSLNNNITNNRAYNNTVSGFFLAYSSNNNFFIGNNASNNSDNGFFLEDGPSNNTFIGNIVNNNSDYGIDVFTGSDGNRFTDNKIYGNGWTGIIFDGSSNNNASDNEIYDNSANGIRITSGSNNNLTRNTIYRSGWYGIFLDRASSNKIINNTINNNTYSGMYLNNSSSNNITNNSMNYNTLWDYESNRTSQNNTVSNNWLGTNNISFTNLDIAIKLGSSQSSEPSGYAGINKFFNITNRSANSWIYINISYTNSEIVSLTESTLQLWRNSSGTWSQVSGTNSVDTANNYVYANITTFSIFGVFGTNVTLAAAPSAESAGGCPTQIYTFANQSQEFTITKCGYIKYNHKDISYRIRLLNTNSSSAAIKSDSFEITLNLNETKAIDLDKDGTKDLEILLVSVASSSARVLLQIPKEAVQITKSVCGNKIAEANETSENCCLDVGCPQNQTCENNACMPFSEIKPAEIKAAWIILLILILVVIAYKIAHKTFVTRTSKARSG